MYRWVLENPQQVSAMHCSLTKKKKIHKGFIKYFITQKQSQVSELNICSKLYKIRFWLTFKISMAYKKMLLSSLFQIITLP